MFNEYDDEEYDVVVDVLTKHRDKLQEMINRNMSSEYVGLNIMDDIRFEQIDRINSVLKAIKEYGI